MSRRDASERAPGQLLVVGVGNVLFGDDAAGAEAVRQLAECQAGRPAALPPATLMVDGGDCGLDVLPLLHAARGVVFIDAVDAGRTPGSIFVLDCGGAGHTGEHAYRDIAGGRLPELLDAALVAGVLPDAWAVVGVQPASIEPRLGLGPEVRSGMPRLVAVAIETAWAIDRRRDRVCRGSSRPRNASEEAA